MAAREPEPLVAPAAAEPGATSANRRGTGPTLAGVLLMPIAAFLGLIGIATTASPSFVIILVVGLISLVLCAIMLRRIS